MATLCADRSPAGLEVASGGGKSGVVTVRMARGAGAPEVVVAGGAPEVWPGIEAAIGGVELSMSVMLGNPCTTAFHA